MSVVSALPMLFSRSLLAALLLSPSQPAADSPLFRGGRVRRVLCEGGEAYWLEEEGLEESVPY